jgi:hypothetical protein
LMLSHGVGCGGAMFAQGMAWGGKMLALNP